MRSARRRHRSARRSTRYDPPGVICSPAPMHRSSCTQSSAALTASPRAACVPGCGVRAGARRRDAAAGRRDDLGPPVRGERADRRRGRERRRRRVRRRGAAAARAVRGVCEGRPCEEGALARILSCRPNESVFPRPRRTPSRRGSSGSSAARRSLCAAAPSRRPTRGAGARGSSHGASLSASTPAVSACASSSGAPRPLRTRARSFPSSMATTMATTTMLTKEATHPQRRERPPPQCDGDSDRVTRLPVWGNGDASAQRPSAATHTPFAPRPGSRASVCTPARTCCSPRRTMAACSTQPLPRGMHHRRLCRYH